MERTFTTHTTEGWRTGGRTDLPTYPPANLLPNGTLMDAAGGLGADRGRGFNAGMPASRRLTYEYVDTGFAQVHDTHVLWSDGASWCTMIALWRMGRAGLAHAAPSDDIAAFTEEFLDDFGEPPPTEIHLVTTEAYFEWPDGFVAVKRAIQNYYGDRYADIEVYLIHGYAGRAWEQKHQLGVDPRSGTYPVWR